MNECVLDLSTAVVNDVLQGIDSGLPAWKAAEACRVPRSVHFGWMMAGAEDVEAGKDTSFARYRKQVLEHVERAQQKMREALASGALKEKR